MQGMFCLWVKDKCRHIGFDKKILGDNQMFLLSMHDG